MRVTLVILTVAFPLVAKGFVITVPPPRKIPILLSEKSSGHDIEKITYHMGGNAHYTDPMVEPALLNSDEECKDVMIDFVTGDELCWNEAPTHPRNVVDDASARPTTTTTTHHHHIPFDVLDDYHKGGNAHYQATTTPTKLSSSSEDGEECEVPFIDFVSGDELCWNDYSKSAP